MLRIAGVEERLSPGAERIVPAGVAHAWWQTGPHWAHVVVRLTPALRAAQPPSGVLRRLTRPVLYGWLITTRPHVGVRSAGGNAFPRRPPDVVDRLRVERSHTCRDWSCCRSPGRRPSRGSRARAARAWRDAARTRAERFPRLTFTEHGPWHRAAGKASKGARLAAPRWLFADGEVPSAERAVAGPADRQPLG